MSDMQLKWSDEYAFGLPDIDFEHQELFSNINKIIELKDETVGVEILVQVHLEFLLKYVDHHFKEEEELFKQTDYPKINEHIKSHDALRETVLDFKKKVDAGNIKAIEEFIPVAKK